jgi:hypothetical protein
MMMNQNVKKRGIFWWGKTRLHVAFFFVPRVLGQAWTLTLDEETDEEDEEEE